MLAVDLVCSERCFVIIPCKQGILQGNRTLFGLAAAAIFRKVAEINEVARCNFHSQAIINRESFEAYQGFLARGTAPNISLKRKLLFYCFAGSRVRIGVSR